MKFHVVCAVSRDALVWYVGANLVALFLTFAALSMNFSKQRSAIGARVIGL
jgi:hypothetical protein